MVLIGYGNSNNRLRLGESVEWMVYQSNCKHLYQSLLPATQQFCESEQQEYGDCNHYYSCPNFWGVGRDQNSVKYTLLSHSLNPWLSVDWVTNGFLDGQVGKWKIEVDIVTRTCRNGSMKNKGGEK